MCKSKKNKRNGTAFRQLFFIILPTNELETFTMLRFNRITPDDKDLIQSYTLRGLRQGCDLSFATIFGWAFLFNTEWAEAEGCLFLRFHFGGQLAYMVPIKKPDDAPDARPGCHYDSECLRRVVELASRDAAANGQPLQLVSVQNHIVDMLDSLFPDRFDTVRNRDYADYIYARERLVNLSGKKLQSKRNFVNRFKKTYPQYEYRALTPELIPECLRLEQLWREKSGYIDADDSTTQALRALSRQLANWDKLGLSGGTIWVDGQLVAFTYGNPVNETTFDVCVEKADTDYEGAFNIINNEFVRRLPEQYTHINREEDMGVEGLRKAKLSYHPETILEKSRLYERAEYRQTLPPETVKAEGKQLWKDTFHDPDAFIDLYFDRVWKPELNFFAPIDGHVAGAVQALPHAFLWRGEELPAAYISGLCVAEPHRRGGVGESLMAQAHRKLYANGAAFVFLLPAEAWLHDWYGAQGYADAITVKPAPMDVSTLSFADYDRWQRAQDAILLHAEADFEVIKATPPATHGDLQGMARVVNVERALAFHAKHHPDETRVLHIRGDRHIAANNAFYVLKGGTVRRTNEPQPAARILTIAQLTAHLLADADARMLLMLE